MKKFVALAIFTVSATCFAQDTYVNGYYRNNGNYVQGHHRSAADGNPYNNYSTRGNTNPYTGQPGYHNPSPSYNSYSNHNSYGNQYNHNNNSSRYNRW